LELAKDYGFVLDETLNFHEFYEEKMWNFNNEMLFKKIGFNLNEWDLMNEQQWECSFLYRTLWLKKISGKDQGEVSRDFKSHHYFKLIE